MGFDENQFEDDAWNDPTVLGIVVAICIVLAVVALGAWLDGNASISRAAAVIAGSH